MNRRGIIAGGNWIVDHVKMIDAWPAQDALVNIVDRMSSNGGGPYNVLKDLAKLRAPFPLWGVGVVGDDADGRAIRADCATHNIDATQLHTVNARTSYTDVMTVRGTGRRTFFHDRGANALLAPGHFDFSLTPARHFHLGYLLLLDTLDAPGADGRPRAVEVLRAARAQGLTTSLDCVSGPPERYRDVSAALAEVDLLFANDYEAEHLTGSEFGRGKTLRRTEVERAARALLERGVRETVVIHFPEGACAASRRDGLCWQPAVAMPASEIAGAAGAGDALAAGVLFARHEGWPLARALELGVCAAAASLRHPSCSEAVLASDACLELGCSRGFMAAPA